LGRWPLGAIQHSSNEPGELSQWLCHDDSTINIVLDIIISRGMRGISKASKYCDYMQQLKGKGGGGCVSCSKMEHMKQPQPLSLTTMKDSTGGLSRHFSVCIISIW